jgi:hypothetical protein
MTLVSRPFWHESGTAAGHRALASGAAERALDAVEARWLLRALSFAARTPMTFPGLPPRVIKPGVLERGVRSVTPGDARGLGPFGPRDCGHSGQKMVARPGRR